MLSKDNCQLVIPAYCRELAGNALYCNYFSVGFHYISFLPSISNSFLSRANETGKQLEPVPCTYLTSGYFYYGLNR